MSRLPWDEIMKIKVSDFTKSAITVFSGAFVSQLIIAAGTFVLSRFYSPAAFGELAVFSSWLAILAGLFTLKFELAIILPEDPLESVRLMKLTIFISLIFSSLCLALFCVYQFSGGSLPKLFLLIPVLTLSTAVSSSFQQWFSKKKQFSVSAIGNILNSSANIGFSLLILLVPVIGSGQLILGYGLGLLAISIYFVFRFWQMNRRIWGEAVFDFRDTFRKYADFPRYMVPASVLGLLSYQIIPLLLKQFFTIESVGYYSMANRFLYVPSVLLGTAIGEVFRVELANDRHHQKDMRPIFHSTLKKMLIMGIPFYVILAIFARDIFHLLLGESFISSGDYSRALSLAIFAQFVTQPFNAIFVVFQRTRIHFIGQAALTIVPVVALSVGRYFFNDVIVALYLISILSFLTSALIVMKAYRIISNDSVITPAS